MISQRHDAMEAFVGSVWRLTREDGTPVAPVLQLLRDGMIGGHANPNERRWTLRGGKIVFLDSDGITTTIFDKAEERDGAIACYSGYSRGDPGLKFKLDRTALPVHRQSNGAPQWRSTRFVAELERPKRDNLVVLCANDRSLHRTWTRDIEDGDRNWDLCISRYDVEPGPATNEYEYLAHQPNTPKFAAIHNLFHAGSPLWNYRYVWLPDDDLMTSWRQINRLFEVSRRHRLLLAQPSLKAESHVQHDITRQDNRFALRFTKFVDAMCPVFAMNALDICLPTFRNAASGHGLEPIWPQLIGSISSCIAVIDTVSVTPTRAFERRDADSSVLRESVALQRLYNAPDARAAGSIGCVMHSEAPLL